jgi:SAM-dependent methyltransferase
MTHGTKAPLKLYRELATWWPVLSNPSDYADEAEFARKLFTESCDELPRTILELGCGGGNNASHLKKQFEMTLTDISAEMLEVSRSLNPECEHVQGDMRTLRLGRVFDGVFVHDAVTYMTSEGDLGSAIATAHVHCRPGGAAVFMPDHVRETFHPDTSHGGHDRGERALRYLEWSWDPDPDDTTYVTDMVYVLREKNGRARIEHDRHVCGLFPRDTWLRLLEEVGFEPRVIIDQYERDVFVARRPHEGA